MFDIDYIIGDYLASVNGQPPIRWSEAREVWDEGVLHVSDLNACPRQVALRLRGFPAAPRPPQEARKFVLANFQHELLYRAFDWYGILIDKEIPVPMPDGWTGTADMVIDEFHDKSSVDGGTVNVGDSKNPVAGAKKYLADYPKPEDILQVSVYSAFLPEIYRELEGQTEGQVFYLPLGGASRGLSTRFPLVPKVEVMEKMRDLEAVRDDIPDPLPLKVFITNRREYTRKDGTTTVSGNLYHGTDWRCSYCRYECPNRKAADEPVFLGKTGTKGLSELTSAGHRLSAEIGEFLLRDAVG